MRTSSFASGAPLTSGRLALPEPRVVLRDARIVREQRRIALWTILAPTAGACAGVLWIARVGFGWLEGLVLAIGVLATQLALELGYHRLLSHRAFRARRWFELLLVATASAAGQGRLHHWVANHRRHHRHSDTELDPHSPFVRERHGVRERRGSRGAERLGLWRGLVHAHWGHMLTDGVPNATLFARDLNRDPALRWINARYGLFVLGGLALPALVGLAIDGPRGAAAGFLWGGLVRIFVVQNVTWSAASLSHRFGARPFEAGDESRNLIWTALPSCGAGYQNNHHAFPRSAFLGLRWSEPDPGAFALRVFERLGLVWDLQRPSAEELRENRRAPSREGSRGAPSEPRRDDR